MSPQGFIKGIDRNGPMRSVPDYATVFDDDHLWRLVRQVEPFGNGIRYRAAFDDMDDAAGQLSGRFDKFAELVVRLAANRALRAMLENEYRIAFRNLQELFEISILA